MAGGPLNLRSARELRLMRPAGLLVWRAHQLVREIVRPGVKTKEIDEAVERIAGVVQRLRESAPVA